MKTMADNEKCPICEGDIVIDPTTGKKVCAGCGTEYVKQEATEKETDKKCPNCGALCAEEILHSVHTDAAGQRQDRRMGSRSHGHYEQVREQL